MICHSALFIRLLVIKGYSYGYESYAEGYYFTDVYVFGRYPGAYSQILGKKGYQGGLFSEQDQEDLLAGTVDYIGFSYYMSFAIDSSGK